MKIYTKFLIASLFFLSNFYVKAQNDSLLKAFINKNDFALRSLQKNALKVSDTLTQINFKELLKLQITSVKLFKTKPEKSASIAYFVRQKCTEFLNKNTQIPIAVFKLSDVEKDFFSTIEPIKKIDSYLTKPELNLINAIDDKNPNLFNEFTVRIN